MDPDMERFPLENLEQKDVQVTTANGVHTYPISETIFLLMLALTRKVDTYIKQRLGITHI
ncbi:hypothetical protein M3699_25310 [Peribacillus simplex]|uniref:hypothetical protein n=1 Tax=Peribacillus simplex TaxID=1478 RepID=UPI00203D757D|nr:hypothetical protein [Peribacillus simplex]MCM3677049.1 hypothetical protein [Peribacillus simplex]